MRIIFTILFLPVLLCCYSQNNIAYLNTKEPNTSDEKIAELTSDFSKFTFNGGLILVKAQIDGDFGAFILDTGAPGLVLNSKEKPENKIIATSVNSSIEVGEVTVKSFKWGNLEKSNVEGYSLDISHMGRDNSESPDGLIGYQILKNNSVSVDFDNQKIGLLSQKDLKEKIKSSENVVSIPFETDGYLPIIKLKINNKTYRFILDTGAEKNLLDEAFFEKVNARNTKYELIQGLDGGIRKVASGEVANLKSKKYKIEKMDFLFSDLSWVNSGQYDFHIDGLLGLPFFQKKNFVIDYRKGKIHIWE